MLPNEIILKILKFLTVDDAYEIDGENFPAYLKHSVFAEYIEHLQPLMQSSSQLEEIILAAIYKNVLCDISICGAYNHFYELNPHFNKDELHFFDDTSECFLNPKIAKYVERLHIGNRIVTPDLGNTSTEEICNMPFKNFTSIKDLILSFQYVEEPDDINNVIDYLETFYDFKKGIINFHIYGVIYPEHLSRLASSKIFNNVISLHTSTQASSQYSFNDITRFVNLRFLSLYIYPIIRVVDSVFQSISKLENLEALNVNSDGIHVVHSMLLPPRLKYCRIKARLVQLQEGSPKNTFSTIQTLGLNTGVLLRLDVNKPLHIAYTSLTSLDLFLDDFGAELTPAIQALLDTNKNLVTFRLFGHALAVLDTLWKTISSMHRIKRLELHSEDSEATFTGLDMFSITSNLSNLERLTLSLRRHTLRFDQIIRAAMDDSWAPRLLTVDFCNAADAPRIPTVEFFCGPPTLPSQQQLMPTPPSSSTEGLAEGNSDYGNLTLSQDGLDPLDIEKFVLPIWNYLENPAAYRHGEGFRMEIPTLRSMSAMLSEKYKEMLEKGAAVDAAVYGETGTSAPSSDDTFNDFENTLE